MAIHDETPQTIEQELHHLEDESDELDQRTGNLEMRNGFVLLFVFVTLGVSIAALVVALVGANKTTTKTVVERVPVKAAAPAAATPVVTPPGTVAVKLGEMFVRPNVKQATAGKVTFHVQNTGKLVHEMIVARAPVKLAPGASKASESTSVGEVSELKPGTSGTVKLSLKPGKYLLFCNVPGHFAAGQKSTFTVKPS